MKIPGLKGIQLQHPLRLHPLENETLTEQKVISETYDEIIVNDCEIELPQAIDTENISKDYFEYSHREYEQIEHAIALIREKISDET